MDEIPFYPFSLEEMRKYPEKGNDVFFRRSNEMIDVAYNNGISKVTLFRVENGDGLELYLNLPKSVWVDTLRDSISYFESIEDYEECAYARDILNRIED